MFKNRHLIYEGITNKKLPALTADSSTLMMVYLI